jgi:hypothetical protein
MVLTPMFDVVRARAEKRLMYGAAVEKQMFRMASVAYGPEDSRTTDESRL